MISSNPNLTLTGGVFCPYIAAFVTKKGEEFNTKIRDRTLRLTRWDALET
jgi:hypothetical protein